MSRKLDPAAIDGLIEAVREAARRFILPRFRNLTAGEVSSKTAPDDLVTIADREAERFLTQAIGRLLPGAFVLGEEAVSVDADLLRQFPGKDMTVILDPVDGTGNFASGLSLFGVILAVRIGGETIFGLLYDPLMDDWVMAEKGGGAWFCRADHPPLPLRGPSARPLAEAHGLVMLFLHPPDRREALAVRLTRFGRISGLRCSCHEYRLFAFGHADFIAVPTARPWDHAAGVLVAEECGAEVLSGTATGDETGYDPTRPERPLIVAARGMSARAIRQILYGG
ncbi:inositol monophosphatase family protein [Rhizobium paknamense]|uniref:Fructose-1,6-bisphosphatase/inositol monophosphatase family enzyme n=1 Tax=Rhizobium paknamense TaxID=1206817 RepID=A0ABU0IAL7_9HYPH|nr:inositol monophosphatase [Rhizobium paknamense]MDQ0454326.1 fructose-1,6-bisphosphatase/inositol monophosphatase family enzyme [Rhizobium paknamense]